MLPIVDDVSVTEGVLVVGEGGLVTGGVLVVDEGDIDTGGVLVVGEGGIVTGGVLVAGEGGRVTEMAMVVGDGICTTEDMLSAVKDGVTEQSEQTTVQDELIVALLLSISAHDSGASSKTRRTLPRCVITRVDKLTEI